MCGRAAVCSRSRTGERESRTVSNACTAPLFFPLGHSPCTAQPILAMIFLPLRKPSGAFPPEDQSPRQESPATSPVMCEVAEAASAALLHEHCTGIPNGEDTRRRTEIIGKGARKSETRR